MKVRLVHGKKSAKDERTGKFYDRDVFIAQGKPPHKEKWGHAEEVNYWPGSIGEERARECFLRWAKFQGHQVMSILGEGYHS